MACSVIKMKSIEVTVPLQGHLKYSIAFHAMEKTFAVAFKDVSQFQTH